MTGPPPRDGRVAFAGDDVWYSDTGGPGPAVVLLHPYAGSGRSFSRQVDAFHAAGHRVVTYSRRGHTGSSGPTDVTATAADELRAVVDTLELGPAHLVASAAGGFVAADFAQSWPDALRTLVLACTMIGIEDDDYAELCRTYRPTSFDEMSSEERELTAAYRSHDPDGVDAWRANLPERPVPLPPQRRPITWQTVERLSVPTLLIAGDHDPYFPPQVMRAVADRVPHATSTVVEGTGHSAYWERPADFNRVVLDFLERASAPQTA